MTRGVFVWLVALVVALAFPAASYSDDAPTIGALALHAASAGRAVLTTSTVNPRADAIAGECGACAVGCERLAAKAVSVADRAAELRAIAGRNRVSIETPNGRLSVDLEGMAHFDKTLGRYVDTPHVKFETRHLGPDGRVTTRLVLCAKRRRPTFDSSHESSRNGGGDVKIRRAQAP